MLNPRGDAVTRPNGLVISHKEEETMRTQIGQLDLAALLLALLALAALLGSGQCPTP